MKFKICSLLLIFNLISLFLYSQSGVDSLKANLETIEGLERYHLLIQIIEETLYQDPQLSIIYSEEALNLLKHDDPEAAKIYNYIGQAQENLDQPEKALIYYEKAITIDNDSQKSEKAYAAFSLGLIYEGMRLNDKAIKNYEIARDLYADLGNTEKQANVLNSIGIIFEYLTVYDKALENYFLANNLYQKIDDLEGIGHTYNNIGNIYQIVNNFNKALQYYEEAIKYYKQMDPEEELSSVYNNIGIVYDDKGDYESALDYYERSLDLAEKADDLEGVSTALNNIGIIYINLGNYELAQQFYRQSLTAALEIDDQWSITNCYLNQAYLYFDTGDFEKCLEYARLGDSLAYSNHFRDLQLEAHNIYSKYYSNNENYQQAFDHYMKYSMLKDSLFQDVNIRISEIQTVFETQQHTKEIQLLRLEKKYQKTINIYYIIFSIILLIVAICLYHTNRMKNREISARKKLEKSIRSIASVVDQAEESIIITDLEGKIVYVNPCFERVTGYKQDEILGKNPSILKSGSTPEEDYVKLWDNLHRGEGWRGIFLNKKKDGTLYYDSSIIFPVKDENNKIINFAAVKHDITKMKETENDLRESEERFRHMADHISEGLMIIENNKVIYINDKMSEITGYDKEELQKLSVFELSAPFEKERVKNFASRIKKDGFSAYEFEFWIKRKDGSLKYFHNGYSTYKGKGNIVNRYIVTTDLTESKKAEDKIVNSLKEKEILLKEINHRVKNNMQVISSLLKLQTDYVDDTNLLNIFTSCQNRVKSMSLVHEKLYQSDDLAKIDAYHYISKLVSNLFTSYSIGRERIKLILDIKDIFLPVNYAIPCGLIINELVTNALKYAFLDNAEGSVIIDFHKVKDKYSLSVKDNGCGLPEGFDFSKNQSMGLSLVDSLIKQLHGTIEFVSENGTEVKIEFS